MKRKIRAKALQGDDIRPTWVIYTDINKGYKGQWNIPSTLYQTYTPTVTLKHEPKS